MPTKRCCCGPQGCTIFSDDFGRADNSSLGANWTEYPSTAFEIFSNTVRSVDGGIALYNTAHPTPSGSMIVSIDTVDEAEGDIYELILNAVDEDNYHVARFIRNDLFDSVIELSIVVAGVETLLNSATVTTLSGTERNFTALIASNEFCAYVTFSIASMVTAETDLIANGYYAGFGSPTVGTQMDNFVFSHHRETRVDCPNCVCQCGDSWVPPCLSVHLEGTGRLATLNCDIEITWDRENSYWEGYANCCDVDWPIILNCGDGLSWDSFTIRFMGLQCVTGNGDNDPRSPVSGSCDPFLLEFGPYEVPGDDLACYCDGNGPPNPGTWSATVTECA